MKELGGTLAIVSRGTQVRCRVAVMPASPKKSLGGDVAVRYSAAPVVSKLLTRHGTPQQQERYPAHGD